MIKLQDLSLQRGTKTLIEKADLEIFPKQKVAIIGQNGCGKSSLFSLFLGQLSPDAGEYYIVKTWEVVAIAQYIDDTSRTTLEYVIDGNAKLRETERQLEQAQVRNEGERIALLHETLEHLGAYDIESRAATILSGLGFSENDLSKNVESFSGGWQMRLNLARALLCPSDLLLLDEPTNHLDLDAVIWLQNYLQNYPGTLLFISHDQAFIDACADTIISFENEHLLTYTGNYTSYQKQRAERLVLQQKQYDKQQQKKQHLESFVRRFKAKASKAKQAQSRVKQLEKMEMLLPAQQDSGFYFEFKPPEKLPNPLINMENIELGYGDKVVLRNIQFNLVPGSRIGLLGRNGAGKSTFIKLLSSELEPMQGRYTVSAGLKIGYFAQHQVQLLDLEGTPFSHLQKLDKQLSDQQIRDYLGGYGFQGDDAFKKVDPMSGGEKARLVLALIVYQKPNLLLLDEPTNHLDIGMREALAYALQSFEGAMVIVSHDRFLLESVCDDFYLVDAGKVQSFKGDLDDYKKWLFGNKTINALSTSDNDKLNTSNQTQAGLAQSNKEVFENTNKTKLDKKTLKRIEAEFRQETKPLRTKIAESEKVMAQCQTKLETIEQALISPEIYEAQNKSKLNELILQQAALKSTFEESEMEWLETSEALEEAMNHFESRKSNGIQ